MGVYYVTNLILKPHVSLQMFVSDVYLQILNKGLILQKAEVKDEITSSAAVLWVLQFALSFFQSDHILLAFYFLICTLQLNWNLAMQIWFLKNAWKIIKHSSLMETAPLLRIVFKEGKDWYLMAVHHFLGCVIFITYILKSKPIVHWLTYIISVLYIMTGDVIILAVVLQKI